MGHPPDHGRAELTVYEYTKQSLQSQGVGTNSHHDTRTMTSDPEPSPQIMIAWWHDSHNQTITVVLCVPIADGDVKMAENTFVVLENFRCTRRFLELVNHERGWV